MGYSTDFTGQLNFSRELTLREYKELQKMNDEPDYCKEYTETPETMPEAYMQWVSNDDGTALVWDGNEKFYDYVHWLRWLIKHFLKPKGIDLNGTLQWQGEEVGDVGVIKVVDNKVTTEKLTIKGLVECPNCGHTFKADE